MTKLNWKNTHSSDHFYAEDGRFRYHAGPDGEGFYIGDIEWADDADDGSKDVNSFESLHQAMGWCESHHKAVAAHGN